MKIGICGVGTVGASLISLIKKNRDEISRKLEDEIDITIIKIDTKQANAVYLFLRAATKIGI